MPEHAVAARQADTTPRSTGGPARERGSPPCGCAACGSFAQATLLQRAVGNRALQDLVAPPPEVQPKLSVGRSDDPLELEADRNADRVVQSEASEVATMTRRKTGASAGGTTDVLRSPGRPLDLEVRRFMEPRFGRDFSQVRIHTDESASRSTEAILARAYTTNSNIAFRHGEYAPDTSHGRHLLAHELTHVVQQSDAAQTAGVVQRDDAPPQAPRSATELDQEYQTAVQMGDWQAAAEWLNGFNQDDIFARLDKLTAVQVAAIHQGALDNPRVGPQAQVALLSDPTRTSHEPTPSSVLPPGTPPSAPPAAAPDPVAQMDTTHKIMAAVTSGINQAPAALYAQLQALLEPKALLEFAGFTLLFAALQATPAGWATDLAIIGLEAYLIGPLVFQGLGDLVDFVQGATNAQDQAGIDKAGKALADALGILGVAIIMKILFHEGGTETEPTEAPNGEAEIEPGKLAKTEPAESVEPADPDAPKTPAEESSFLERTAPKDVLSPTELKAEREIADRGEGQSINEPPFTEKHQLPNGHEYKETPDGKFVERCTVCHIYNSDGVLTDEDFAAPEGPDAVGRRANPPSYEVAGLADSSILAKNMRAAGDLPSAEGSEAHHIVPGSEPEAADLREHLRQNGITDINDPANGVWLPRGPEAPNPDVSTRHEFTFADHPEYFDALKHDLMGLDGEAAIRSELATIKFLLSNGKYPP
jgi:hypothetical protein